MSNKKGKKKNNLFKEIILWGLVILGCVGGVYLLVPEIYAILMYLLSLSVNVLSVALIGSAILGITIALGLVTKCIEIKTEYEFINTDELDQNTELMREQLRVVKANDRVVQKTSTVTSEKYSYVFDNHYEDTEDVMIDDIENPGVRMVVNDNYMSGYTRKRAKYTGKYLR